MVIFILHSNCNKNVYNVYNANIGDLDQTLRSAVSDLGLHRLHMSHKKDAMLIWVKENLAFLLYFFLQP